MLLKISDIGSIVIKGFETDIPLSKKNIEFIRNAKKKDKIKDYILKKILFAYRGS